MNNKIRSIFMVGYAIVCLALASCGGNSEDNDNVNFSDIMEAADSLQKTAKAMANIAPSPYEAECLPLIEHQETIMESIGNTPISESQRAELVDIYTSCYDSITQEIKITKDEFGGLSKSSVCLTVAGEFSDRVSESKRSIETFSKMPLAKTEENKAAKAAAVMLPINIGLIGAQAVLNRMSSCTLEKSGFNLGENGQK